MKNILTQGTDTEFQSWMEDYFKNKSPQDLRNILLSHEPGLAEYFVKYPLEESILQIPTNSLEPWMLIDLPVDWPSQSPGYSTQFIAPNLGLFYFLCLNNGSRKGLYKNPNWKYSTSGFSCNRS
jgi:hypothetical protein